MATSTVTSSQRCLFMELPSEIRVMIYEAIAEAYAQDWLYIHLKDGCASGNSKTKELLALTWANRTMRQESIPVLYRNVQVNIEPDERGDTKPANNWLGVVDPAIISTISKFKIYPVKNCVCAIIIDLENLTSATSLQKCGKVHIHDPATTLMIEHDRYNIGEAIKAKLKLEKQRRVMSKPVLMSELRRKRVFV